MDPPHQDNSHATDHDEELIPAKKRRLTGESSHVDLLDGDFNDNAIKVKEDSICNRNDHNNSDGVDDRHKKGALNILDDIFEDLTEDNPVSKSTIIQNKNDISRVNDLAEKNENNKVMSRHKGNDHDFKQDDLNLVNDLSFTSDTQEYELTNDSLDSALNMADVSNEQKAMLNDKDEAVSAKRKHGQNVIVLDDEASESFSKEGIHNANDMCIKKIPSLARDAQIISSIVPSVNYNIIYNKLLENRDNGNRLDFVTANLLETTAAKEDVLPKPTKSIIEDVELVIKQFPTADADLVYAFLESIENEGDRVEKTIKEMGLKKTDVVDNKEKEKPTVLKKDNTLVDDPVLASDPLFNDMRKVAKVFPDRDRNEIYALLEAHFDKSNRIQVVINELLCGMPRTETSDNVMPNAPVESLPNNISKDDTPAVIDLTDNARILPEQEDVEHLQLLFPDCDPNYLFERIEAMKGADRRMVLAAELTEKKEYPKLQERLEKEKLDEEKKKKISRNFTFEEFLNKFPDPKATFGNPTKPLSDAYKAHARASLFNDFLLFKADYLRKTLEEYNFHYYLAAKKLLDILVRTPVAERRQHKRFMKARRKSKVAVPTENDEYFFHEYWFTNNELNIEDYKKQKEVERQAKVEDAREKGELYECCCCFDDECLFEDLANCPEGHLFCKVCVVRSTEAAFGEMKNRFPCLTGECDQDIPLSTLQRIIPPNLFSKIVSRLQEEEVLQAQIPDLVTCPFCPFATIMPDPDDKVLKCLNPECLKESCRLCREDSHIPLKCNEVESRAGTKMRTYIENRVAEAVMRKCHKCGKRFLKESGCNKMTCVCRATSCYFCKEPDIDYSHFENSKKCGQADPQTIHERDMKEAAKKAMEDYILEHPEAADLDLQSDLKDLIQNYDPNTRDNEEPSSDEESMEVDDDTGTETDSDDY